MTTPLHPAAALDWLNANWMFLAFPLTAVLVAFTRVLSARRLKGPSASPIGTDADDGRVAELTFLAWLALPVYATHQFEEHGYDLFGRRYHFIEYFNDGFPKQLGVQLTPTLITVINVVQVHAQFAYYAHLGEVNRQPVYSALIHAMCAVNAGGAHLLAALLSNERYNPGCAQSLLMLPLSLYALYRYYRLNRSPGWMLICLFFGSAYAHGLSLMLPLKLLSMGVLPGGDLGYLAYAVVMAYVFPALVVPFAPATARPSDVKSGKQQ